VSAPRVLSNALEPSDLEDILTSRPNHVIAVGKAAGAMAAAFLSHGHLHAKSMLVISTHGRELLAHRSLGEGGLPSNVEFIESSHPFPDHRSEAAGNRAMQIAEGVHSGEVLVILLSGGASALMAAPIDGVSLQEKIATTRLMMNAGADIHALNTVRRHLSKIKGGRLAGACVGTTITLALSDVVGDDLNAIGSGPGVPDTTTWADAAAALHRFGGDAHARSVRDIVAKGVAGELADTPKPGDHAMRRVRSRVIGSRKDAMEGARAAAATLGYHTVVLPDAVTGEAREVAPRWLEMARASMTDGLRPLCVISSGETTVTVTGKGTGGRNLEFALSLVEPLSTFGTASLASVGTDGIDGSSGVAGAIADFTTLQRATGMGLGAPGSYLAANDSFAFFAPLDDAVRLGRTDTNVGDLQVLLID
jgi:glycerate 2-kinase